VTARISREAAAEVNAALDCQDLRFVETGPGAYSLRHIERAITVDLDGARKHAVLHDLAYDEKQSFDLGDVAGAAHFVLVRPDQEVLCDRSDAYGEEEYDDFINALRDFLEEYLNPLALTDEDARRVRQVMEHMPRGLHGYNLGPIQLRQCERLVKRGVLRKKGMAFFTATKFICTPGIVFRLPAGHTMGASSFPRPQQGGGLEK